MNKLDNNNEKSVKQGKKIKARKIEIRSQKKKKGRENIEYLERR